jgi:transcriptional regulator with XRE-family HTH domain
MADRAPDPDNVLLGTELRRLREMSGRSLNALAREAGIDPGRLHRIENGSTTMGWKKLVQLTRALGVTVEEVTNASGAMRRTTHTAADGV